MDQNDLDHASFERNGFLVLKGFYDVQRDIEPIRASIRDLVELIARKHGLNVPCATAEQAMTEGYRAIIAADRSWGAEIYDAIKQIPAYMQLVANPRNAALFEALRPGSFPGLAGQSYGIRIDNPGEEKFRSIWHQEFPGQLRSLDGIVFWSPLLSMSQRMGPVELSVGSHKGGLFPTIFDDGGVGRYGAYSLRIEREEEILARYGKTSPLTEAGDLLVMDFLTLHQSGWNASDRPRWSMQFRYFNFNDPTGQKICWQGSYTAGVDPTDLLSRLFSELRK